MKAKLAAALPFVAVYVGSVVVANYVTTRYGFIPVGFGQTATAGTFAAGAALVVRDALQDLIGRLGIVALIAVTALLSYAVSSPQIAFASGAAFAVSELLDMALYTPLRKRGRFGGRWWSGAVLAGGIVGAIADTLVFLTVAFGFSTVQAALVGQLVGKGEVVIGFLVLGALAARVNVKRLAVA